MGCAGVFLMLFPGWLRCSPDAFRTVCEVYRAPIRFRNVIHILEPCDFILCPEEIRQGRVYTLSRLPIQYVFSAKKPIDLPQKNRLDLENY